VSSPANDSAAAALAATTLKFLRQYPPFEQMEEQAAQFLAASLDLCYFPKGTVILAPDQSTPPALHIIQRGTVQVVPFGAEHGGDAEPLSLGPGESFSVSALLEQRAVMAPYTATADTFCYELAAEKFPELLNRSPVFREFATRYLASMLRESRRLIKLNFTSTTGEQQAMSRTLRSLITRAPVTCPPERPIGEALRSMQESKVGSMLIAGSDGRPLGILTRHDVLDRVALAQHDLTRPISDVMTPDPLTLPAEDSAYDAALLIADRGIRHIPVCDGNRVIGVVTERDLFALQRISVRAINRTISAAQTIDELCSAAKDIHKLARSMLGQGVAAEQLTLIISTLNDALVRQVLTIEGEEFDLDGLRWCWLAFGSEGRYEQTISTDQDNGLIFDAGDEQPDAARERLIPFALAVNRALDRCGFPLCQGNIMGSNPQWCLSLAEWRRQFESWIANTNPQALLNAVIFFDFRAVHGEEALARKLRSDLSQLAQDGKQFQRQLAGYALESRPPLGIISDFVTESDGKFRGTIDLKKNGARLFTDAARLLALATGVAHTNTAERLRQAGASLQIPDKEIESITEAFFFLQTLRLRSQMEPEATAENANRVDPAQLNEVDRRILKESFRQARKLQSRVALDYQL
jgi:CBS domain-containing protein